MAGSELSPRSVALPDVLAAQPPARSKADSIKQQMHRLLSEFLYLLINAYLMYFTACFVLL